jgi:hypothetical protein
VTEHTDRARGYRHGDAGQAFAVMSAGRYGRNTQPSAAMLAAYEADPELAARRLDFTASLLDLCTVLLAGLLAGSGG